MITNEENTKLGLTVDEAREMLGIGRNLMLQLVKVKGFPAVRFKRKIIINKELLPKWFIMEKINRQRAPKGTVTIRKKGNSYEARVTIALNSIMEGVDKNPRLSRTARSEKEARKRLGELITDVYFDIKRNSTIPNVKVFTDECSTELNKFTEFNEERERRKIEILADDYTLFPNIAKEWLNWKKKQVNPSTNKTISLKTVETYINTIKNHVMVDFKKYHVSEISKDLVENYINEKRQKTPRLAKDLFLLIRAVLTYAKDKKGLIKEIPNFDLKFQKKKRAKVTKVCYLPEEGCGLKWKSVHFNQNKIKVENAYKDITLYDDEMNITGHIMTDGDLKTTESYRSIPMTPRLKEMLLNLKKEKSSQDSLENYHLSNGMPGRRRSYVI